MDDDEIEDEIDETLWAETSAGVYGAVVEPHGRELPPGIYKISTTAWGEVRFVTQRLRDEPLMRFEGVVDKIIDEIKYFWSREAVYKTLGIPYKRGILLYGPPGTGKTSIVRLALDDVIARGGIGILFEDVSLLEQGLETFRSIQKDAPVVVIVEDLDSHCSNEHYESKILNLLDGTSNIVNNTVFVATTNYEENLSDRIKNRPSRFDKKFEIDFPPAKHRALFLQKLLSSVPAGLDTFQDRLDFDTAVDETEGLSLAHIKELFTAVVVLGNDYSETMKMLTSDISSEDEDEDDGP